MARLDMCGIVAALLCLPDLGRLWEVARRIGRIDVFGGTANYLRRFRTSARQTTLRYVWIVWTIPGGLPWLSIDLGL
jgi:hypothetical protein